jgi:hypothetical protein
MQEIMGSLISVFYSYELYQKKQKSFKKASDMILSGS